MRTYTRSRAALVGASAIAAIVLTGPLPAAAAPYTVDAVVTVSTTNPAIGATITIQLVNFGPNELIDVHLHSTPVLLATVQADANGSATAVVTLPSNYMCEHTIVATGRTTGEVASTTLLIGPPSACRGNSGSGNVGNGNSGHGNVGNNNSGHGNVGNSNGGHGNVGDDNTGHGNVSNGNSGWGNVVHSTPFSADEGTTSAAAAVVVIGMATIGGVAFARRRRPGA